MSTPHRNNLKERAAQGLVTHDNTGGYFVVECQGCSAVYPSFQCVGGGQIADTGDYDDARCPHCGQEAPEECDNVGLAWNVQQERINALQQRLNAADQKDDDQAFQLKDREGSRRDWFEEAQRLEKECERLREERDSFQRVGIQAMEHLAERGALLIAATRYIGNSVLLAQIKAALSASAGPCVRCHGCGKEGVQPDHFDNGGKCVELQVPSAPAERDERAMTKAFHDWAFYKKGEAIGRMDGQQAGLEGFIAGADWQARAALDKATEGASHE